jgi:hypothetical protein
MRCPALVLALLGVAPGLPAAEPGIDEVIELRSRPAEAMARLLRPLAGPGVGIGGSGRQLLLRAPADRLAGLRELVTALDRPPRQLLVSVFQGRLGDAQRRALLGETEGTRPPGGASGVRAHRTRSPLDATRHLRLSEGEKGFVASIESPPSPHSVFFAGPGGIYGARAAPYRPTVSGFLVQAAFAGDRVSVLVRPVLADPDGLAAAAAATTLSGVPGQWLPVARTSLRVPAAGGDRVSRHATLRREETEVWLKVELAD